MLSLNLNPLEKGNALDEGTLIAYTQAAWVLVSSSTLSKIHFYLIEKSFPDSIIIAALFTRQPALPRWDVFQKFGKIAILLILNWSIPDICVRLTGGL